MNSDEVQILYENVIFYDIFKVFNDETRSYVGTTHVPDIALRFCKKHKDCIIERNTSNFRLIELEDEYQKFYGDDMR